MLTVYIVRYGQADHNIQGVVQGHLNTPLNAVGLAQGEMPANRLQAEGVPFDVAFSSNLERASQTALASCESRVTA
ncbi:hypothetical protein NCC49_003849 [Naganishia albida]|nr:hypothetical protein NCC49_003849 [Naganishia albida]